MHCYFITLNFFALYFYPKNTEETGSAASNQAKLFLMTLIFDLMLSDIVLYYFFFFTILEICRGQTEMAADLQSVRIGA